MSSNFEVVRNSGKCLRHISGQPFLAQVQLLHWFGLLVDIVANRRACLRLAFPKSIIIIIIIIIITDDPYSFVCHPENGQWTH
jgi:hypothetical protein